jgi:hypothetical protein
MEELSRCHRVFARFTDLRVQHLFLVSNQGLPFLHILPSTLEIENENAMNDDRAASQRTLRRCDVSSPHCGNVSSIIPKDCAHL